MRRTSTVTRRPETTAASASITLVAITAAALTLVMGALLGPGCSDDDADGGGLSASPCGEQATAVCTAACNCSGGTACKIVDGSEGMPSSLEFQDQAACQDYYFEMLCTDGNPSAEADALFQKVTDCGQCQTDGQGASVIQIPQGCGTTAPDAAPDAAGTDAGNNDAS